MARKKSKPIEEEVIANATEEVIEEESVTEIVTEEVEVAVADSSIEEESEEVIEDKGDQFFFTQLKMINKLNNPAKAKRLSERVLRNRKR